MVAALRQGTLRGYGKEALRLLDRDPDPRISPIILVELEFLREIGRLRESAEEIVGGLAGDFGLRVCGLEFENISRQAAKEGWTRDPFDRMIVAQARVADAPLITLDGVIRSHYARAIG